MTDLPQPGTPLFVFLVVLGAGLAGILIFAVLVALGVIELPPPPQTETTQIPVGPDPKPIPFQSRDYTLRVQTADLKHLRIKVHIVARSVVDIDRRWRTLGDLESPIEAVVSRWALQFPSYGEAFTTDSYPELESRLRADVVYGFEVAQIVVACIRPDEWDLRDESRRRETPKAELQDMPKLIADAVESRLENHRLATAKQESGKKPETIKVEIIQEKPKLDPAVAKAIAQLERRRDFIRAISEWREHNRRDLPEEIDRMIDDVTGKILIDGSA